MENRKAIPVTRDVIQLDLDVGPTDDGTIELVTTKLPRPDLFVRKTPPSPTAVFETYWHFAKIRQHAFFERLSHPNRQFCSHDAILRHYRFTNVFRASDRVSQYLIRNVLYDSEWSVEDLVFRTLVFKFFNKIETWEALLDAVGVICWDRYDFQLYERCLSKLMARGDKIYSAAYIMPSGKSAFGHERKHCNHLKVIESIMSDRVPERLAQQPDLESVYRLLRRYPCIGPFIGYQLAIDINYSPLIDFSENSFVEPGPGALDGISKCFSDLGDYSPTDIIHYMADIQDDAFELFASEFRNLWGRTLHLIDCQNLFCEVGKYARVVHPEIEGRSKRTRIKQSYRPASRPIEKPWYPPKWGLNEVIENDRLWAI